MIYFNDFTTVFLSILLESFPFLLLGALIASIIHLVTDERGLERFLPRSPLLQMVAACFLGFLFPVCECAVIPVARALIRRGVPVSTAIVFMLASPIINPIALFATYTAARSDWSIVVIRAGLGLFIALVCGLLLRKKSASEVLLPENPEQKEDHDHHHTHGKISFLVRHTLNEFWQVGFFLIIGAAVSSSVQQFLPVEAVLFFRSNGVLSIAVMQIMGYLLSLCSYADAFVAMGFSSVFPMPAIFAFLIISPLIDVKNTLVLSTCFKKEFIVSLIGKLFLFSFLAALIIMLSRSYG